MVNFSLEMLIKGVLIKRTLSCNGCEDVITPIQDSEITQTSGQRRAEEDLMRAFQRMSREYGADNIGKIEIINPSSGIPHSS
jgi:thiazole synthase ThiGH ThiG subunit